MIRSGRRASFITRKRAVSHSQMPWTAKGCSPFNPNLCSPMFIRTLATLNCRYPKQRRPNREARGQPTPNADAYPTDNVLIRSGALECLRSGLERMWSASGRRAQ